MPVSPFDSTLAEAARLVAEAERIVCLTGAGVSAESGIATFREAQTGLWSRFDPQVLASPKGFAQNPTLVWRWYCERLEQVQRSQPNAGHVALARLEAECHGFVLVTQNVDNLHERAGSHNVIHLHGRIDRFRCSHCFEAFNPEDDELRGEMPPSCPDCGALIRPDVVWFGEQLPADALEAATEAAVRADLLISVGTSGIVYPAAYLPSLAKSAGASLIDINPEAGPMADQADVFLEGASGEILPALVASMED